MENIFLNFSVTFTYVQSGVDNNTYTSDAYLNTKLDYFYFYTLAVIIWSGLVLNAMCILCFIMSKSLKRSTTGIYLIALASADFIYLSGDMLRWLNIYIDGDPYFGLSFNDDYQFWCKITYYLRYFGKLVSAWLTVAITFERYISIRYPLQAGNISTKRNTRIVIIGIYLCCAALTLYPFWTIGLEFLVDDYGKWSWCSFMDRTQYNIWQWTIVWAGSLFIPTVILVTVTTMIIIKLSQMKKQRRGLIGQNKTKHPIERQLTIMLIVVVIAFLILRLPYTITYFVSTFKRDIWDPVTPNIENAVITALRLTDLLASSNYSVNFYLYCLAGSSFRGQFVALVCCCRDKKATHGHLATSSPGNTLTLSSRSSTSLTKLNSVANKKSNAPVEV